MAASGDDRWLRHLRWVGLLTPFLFLVGAQFVRPRVEAWWPGVGHQVVGAVTIAGSLLFGWFMFAAFERGYRTVVAKNRELERRTREQRAVHDVLLRISRGEPLLDTLTAVAREASVLLDAGGTGICLEQPASSLLGVVSRESACGFCEGQVCVGADGVRACAAEACPLSDIYAWPVFHSVPVTAGDGSRGELWVGRGEQREFTAGEIDVLGTLAEATALAIDRARLVEAERLAAIVAERDRISRELHDSLAQVLGVAHLRLCALESRPDLADHTRARTELASLGELCREAYTDVREAILGLREANKLERSLLASLRSYAEHYTRHSGIAVRLDAQLDGPLHLEPQCEVQVIRVIQEALTNVRKHAGVTQATLEVREGPAGVRFVVADHGCGFDPAVTRAEGFGLGSMRERVELIGGTLRIDTAPGRGTRVIVDVPATQRIPGPSAVAP